MWFVQDAVKGNMLRVSKIGQVVFCGVEEVPLASWLSLSFVETVCSPIIRHQLNALPLFHPVQIRIGSSNDRIFLQRSMILLDTWRSVCESLCRSCEGNPVTLGIHIFEMGLNHNAFHRSASVILRVKQSSLRIINSVVSVLGLLWLAVQRLKPNVVLLVDLSYIGLAYLALHIIGTRPSTGLRRGSLLSKWCHQTVIII